MRVGVIDAGSHTVRLVVADADGQVPLPVHTAKRQLRLAELADPDGRLGDRAVAELAAAVGAAREEARRWRVAEPFAFATAVVRDAPNARDIVRAVRERTDVVLQLLPGEKEAELTFLAARRWMGWRAGPMAVLDIGGGSFEVACGRSRLPDFAIALPLGAARLTREFFGKQDPPPPAAVKAVRRHVRHRLRDVAARIRWEAPRTTVVTSRTMQQLARLCGAAPGRHGPFVPRTMAQEDLRRALKQLRGLPAAERARLPGISPARARQSLAGAVVAHTAMKLMSIDVVTVCPWAIREGILLRTVEEGSVSWWTAPAGDEPRVPGQRRPHPGGLGLDQLLPPVNLAN
ncbi:Ppx/GppA family phosphatase [Streptomyces sp. B8F3]|uniref:Ppx/GppA phosphatase family protein n=1 Tax=unclassified Streptomyces TaxID=2593676 RepID=UPI00325E8706